MISDICESQSYVYWHHSRILYFSALGTILSTSRDGWLDTLIKIQGEQFVHYALRTAS